MFSLKKSLIVACAVVAAGLTVWTANAALTQVTTVFTIDNVDPSGFTNPVDDDCPAGAPCKVKSDLNVSDTNQPAPSLTTISPSALSGAIGTSIPNGTIVGNTHVILKYAPVGGCSSPLKTTLEDTQNFLDGGIKGEVADDASAAALANTGVWPTRLESDLRVSELLASGHPVRRRSVAVLSMPLGLTIPINLLVFDVSDGDGFGGLTLAGTYSVAVGGDPTSPPSGAMCAPMTSGGLLLGRSDAGLMLQTCQELGTHTLTSVLTREVGGALVFDATVSDTVVCSMAPIGGVADVGDVDAGSAIGTNDSSRPAALAVVGIAASMILLVVGGWYARRRWLY